MKGQRGILHFHLLQLLGYGLLAFIIWFLYQSWQDGILQTKFRQAQNDLRSAVGKIIEGGSFYK